MSRAQRKPTERAMYLNVDLSRCAVGVGEKHKSEISPEVNANRTCIYLWRWH